LLHPSDSFILKLSTVDAVLYTIAAAIVEAVMTPLTYMVVGWLKKEEGVDYYDVDTNFNPFIPLRYNERLPRNSRTWNNDTQAYTLHILVVRLSGCLRTISKCRM
jgi:hypothetical protein